MTEQTKAQDQNVRAHPSEIKRMIGLTLFALLFGGSAGRTVPGGPFISVIGDILPAAASLTVMRLGRDILRAMSVPFSWLWC